MQISYFATLIVMGVLLGLVSLMEQPANHKFMADSFTNNDATSGVMVMHR